MKSKMLVVVPFTGLGLYNGFRGNRWLRNRIKVFETFVVPSLLNQSDTYFTLWVAWREEEKNNHMVQELYVRLRNQFNVVFTYAGVPMYDDKYDDPEARERLFNSLRRSLPELMDATSDCEEVYWLLQPSDDCYHKETIASVKNIFKDPTVQAASFTEGYICNYATKEVRTYNPKTNPPFAAIKFPRATFFDAGRHMGYISIKSDQGKYPKGTPLPSHEYLPQCLATALFEGRGFLVGCHGENISTHFNHPYGGEMVDGILADFGIGDVQPLALPISYRKALMRKLPHQWQRKLRYWFGEIIYSRVYNWIRN